VPRISRSLILAVAASRAASVSLPDLHGERRADRVRMSGGEGDDLQGPFLGHDATGCETTTP
jgi:hypothetical protein